MPREPLPQSASDITPPARRPEDTDTVKLTLVPVASWPDDEEYDRAEDENDDIENDIENEVENDIDEPEPRHLPGVIVRHIDALRSRGADDEVLELVTVELRKITGVRSRRYMRGA